MLIDQISFCDSDSSVKALQKKTPSTVANQQKLLTKFLFLSDP